MISFDKVSKIFTTPEWPLPILTNTTLTVPSGSFSSLMGPSGSGKTTFMNLIAWLDTAEKWSVIVNKTNLWELSNDERTRFRGKNISFIFQKFYLLPQLTVTENIDLVISLNNLVRRYETEEILEKVWLAGRGKSYPSILSWWEQQRVAVARAFVGKTPILLADEPTGNLDQRTAQQVMKIMIELYQEVWNTIIMITHDPDTAILATQQYILKDQNIVLQ